MANVFFKRGLQANLPATGSNGAFYLTTDTNRLYVCNSDNGPLVELNQSINTVAKMSDLPTGTSEKAKGQYYYITEVNALAYFDGTDWIQINPDTMLKDKTQDTTVTAIDKGVTIQHDVEDTASAAKNGPHHSKGSFSVIGGTNITVSKDGDGFKIDAAAAADMYNKSASLGFDANGKLTVSVEDNKGPVSAEVTPTLKYGNTEQTVKFVNGEADLDVYTITEVNAKLDEKANKAESLAGYGIKDAYTQTEVNNKLAEKADKNDTYTKTEVNTELDKKADKATTYTKTEVDTELAKKANKATTLAGYEIGDAYTKTEVDNLLDEIEEDFAQQLQVADALHYCGTVSQAEAATKLDITKAANGDTYKASTVIDYSGIKANKGDLIIADGTENEETGLLTSGTWEVISSGDDQVIIGDITGNTYKVKDGTEVLAELELKTAGENLADIEWTTSGSKLTGTFKHAGPGADASDIKTGESSIQDPKGALTISALEDIKYDANGHIIEATKATYYVTDTDTHNHLSDVSIIVPYDPLDDIDEPGKFTVTVAMSDGESKSASLEFTSNTLKIASKNSDEIGIDLEWGSF